MQEIFSMVLQRALQKIQYTLQARSSSSLDHIRCLEELSNTFTIEIDTMKTCFGLKMDFKNHNSNHLRDSASSVPQSDSKRNSLLKEVYGSTKLLYTNPATQKEEAVS